MSAEVALITGASSGIGAEFAKAYAAQGANVFLVARREDRLRQLAAALQARYAIRAETLALDLTERASGRRLAAEVARRGYRVHTLINNAGFGTVGTPFAEVPLPRSMDMAYLNMDTLVELSGLYLPGMLAQGRGDIINVASTAAFQPIANVALYAATKAFVLNFSLGIWAEVEGSGVRVLALCPGNTATEWATTAGVASDRQDPAALSARRVVRVALRALERNAGFVVVAPPQQTFFRWLVKLAPRKLVARATRRMSGG
jgi:short-subunit dehydrogenase